MYFLLHVFKNANLLILFKLLSLQLSVKESIALILASIAIIKFIGSNTITANQEKQILQALAFTELGRVVNNQDIQPKRDRIQSISKLNVGKSDIINKGRQWSFKIKFKTHYNSSDNAVLNAILQSNNEFWVWINDNQESIMVMMQEPYRFQDIFKVAFQKSDSIRFSKNMMFSGIDVDFDLVEVA